jgi:hypothetical protein
MSHTELLPHRLQGLNRLTSRRWPDQHSQVQIAAGDRLASRAQELTTRIVSTSARAEKKSQANSATSLWSSVGNLSGEIINSDPI